MKIGCSGHFTLIKNGVVISKFDNLILDSGLDQVANGTQIISQYCRLGTGSSTPTTGQIALDNQQAFKNGGNSTFTAETTSSPRYNKVVIRYTFAAGTLDGNYTEIGIGPTQTGPLFSRALTVNSSGDIAAITVTPTDIFDVVYELRTYIPGADVVSTCVIEGVTYDYTLRPIDINNNSYGGSNQFFAINGNIATQKSATIRIYAYTGAALVSSTSPNPTSSASAFVDNIVATYPITYSAGSGLLNMRFQFAPTQLNVSGGSFNMLKIGPRNALFQILFDPPVPKTSDKTFVFDMAIQYSRYTP